MPRPARPWFRFYSETVESWKFDQLPDRLVKHWIKLLCLANTHEPRGRLPSLPKIAYALRVNEERAKGIMSALLERKFIDAEGQSYVMHDWDDWQQESDANLSPGRRVKNAESPRKERAKNAEPPRYHGVEKRRKETEKEEEGEGEKDAEENSAPAYPFSVMFTHEFQRRNAGRPPSRSEHASAVALEREYGADVCIQLASDYDWDKGPNYLRKVLADRREVKPPPNGTSKPKSLRYGG